MLETSGEDSLLSFVMSECGRAQAALAFETLEHESKLEQYVAAPLVHILATDVPNIMKHKRNLQRLILDMDSTKARYLWASKHNVGGTYIKYKKIIMVVSHYSLKFDLKI